MPSVSTPWVESEVNATDGDGAVREKGFTVVELMLVLVVAAILLGVGVPAFRSLLTSNQLTTTSNALVASLNLARQEAVSRGEPVAACPSPNGTACSGGTDWAVGWMVFVDNGSTPAAFDGGDTLVRVHEAVGGVASIAGDSVIRYTAWGALDTAY